MSFKFPEMFKPIPLESHLVDPNYFIWGASLVQEGEGDYHLYYSRWPRILGHYAWVTHSEIAHAVSTSPGGPFKTVGTALGPRDFDYWDGVCVHNPNVHFFDGRYYLYYMGLSAEGLFDECIHMGDTAWWEFRNKQRIGVAVAESPYGPWDRSYSPLIDVGGPGSHDCLLVSNPSVTRMRDGKFLMIYKAVAKNRELPQGGPVSHLTAVAERPEGPFEKNNQPIFTKPGVDFPAEDPFVWFDPNDDCYYAILKDMEGSFTGCGKSLALFKSDDAAIWEEAEDVLVSDLTIEWEDSRREQLSQLERPQLWIHDGQPEILFLAAARDIKHSFNVHIPLMKRNLSRSSVEINQL